VSAESRRQVRVLSVLHDMSVGTTSLLSPTHLAQAALAAARQAFGDDVKGTLVWYDSPRRRLWPLAATENFGALRWMDPGKGAIGLAFSRKRPVHLADYARWRHRQPQDNVSEIRSVMAVPLATQDRCVGALGVHSPEVDRFKAEDVRLLARVESGHLQLEPAPVRLADIAGEVVAAVEPLLAAQRLELASNVPDFGLLMLDRRKIHQVLLNLLSNAVKFTPEDGLLK